MKPPQPDQSRVTTAPLTAVGDDEISELSLRVFGEGVFATWPLLPGDTLIGRTEDAAVRIDLPSISRRHALIRFTEGTPPQLSLEDLSSSNGTRVRGTVAKLGQPVAFAPGDLIDLGSVVAVVQPRAAAQRLRRVWPHGYFELRVEEEMSRGGVLSLARAHFDPSVPAESLERRLVELLGPADLLARWGPHELELLWCGCDADHAARKLDELKDELLGFGLTACASVTSGRDGQGADELLSALATKLKPSPRTAATGAVVVKDPAMRQLHQLIERFAKGNISILLLGETGVGKEVLADEVHRRSARASKSLLKLNCAAFSETLLESELFGHEKGAFTGAAGAKAGLLESADGGSVFLDEVGELPLLLQAKLLRVLEERRVMRVGAVKARDIDVRFISATNKNLEAEVARGTFRQDLFFRLNGASLVIPPLRERPGEIEALAQRFAGGVPLSKAALDALRTYRWPGNIRELRNVIERAALLTDSEIRPEHLPLDKMSARVLEATPAPREGLGDGSLATIERQSILSALEQCDGNQTKAAALLKISRRTLISRLDEYQVARPRKGRP